MDAGEELWAPPPLSVCEPEDVMRLIETPDEEVGLRLRTYEHRLVDYAIWHRVRTPINGWTDVSRVDCAHGSVHLHLFARTGGDEIDHVTIAEIHRVEDVEDAYHAAHAAVHDRREQNKVRWARGF